MQSRYRLEPAQKADMPAVFDMIDSRIKWMDARGLRQWNAVDYWGIYPEAHYDALREAGELYVLRDIESGKAVCAAALLERDERWDPCEDRDVPAYYVHHLASEIGERGAGSEMIAQIEALAKEHGKAFVRLDCMVDSPFLNEFYGSRGYMPRGSFVEGDYEGLRREKRINP